MARALTVEVLAALVGSGPGAIPATETTPTVVVEQCPEVDVDELGRLLELELELSPASATLPARVSMRCSDGQVVLEARDPARSTLSMREVPRSSSEGAERAYALALHQLLTRPPRVETAPSTVPAPARRNVADPKVPVSPLRKPRPSKERAPRTFIELGVGGLGRSLDRDPLPSGRIELEALYWFDPNLAFFGVVAAEAGGVERTGGTALAWSITAGPGVALRSPQSRGWRWTTRLSIPIGFGSVRGRAEQGFTGTAIRGLAVDTLLRTGAQWTSRRITLGIDLLAGLGIHHPRGLVADDESVTLGGVVLGSMLSVGVGVGS